MMLARVTSVFRAPALVFLACLLMLTCATYAGQSTTQKSTQQAKPATGAVYNPNAPPQGTIAITSPQNGKTMYTGSYYPIEWTCNGTGSNLVDVTFCRDNRLIATIWTGAETGRTAYIIPWNTIAGGYEVRVTSKGDNRIEARLPVNIVPTTVTPELLTYPKNS